MRHFFRNAIIWILTKEASFLLRRTHPFVIAITGSVGKTSMKDMIALLLERESGDPDVRKSAKSFNSEIGIPLTVLGLTNAWSSPIGWLFNVLVGAFRAFFSVAYPRTLVLEVGADHPGDIRRAAAWLHPHVAVVTRLPDTPVHVEYFPGPEAVRQEKAELVRALDEHGAFVGNGDDPAVLALSSLSRAPFRMYGSTPGSFVEGRASEILYDERSGVRVPVGMKFFLLYNGEPFSVELRGVLGTHFLSTVLGAFAVGLLRGRTIVDMRDALAARFVPPSGRMRLLEGVGDTTIIDDSYNSSPVAVLAALSALRETEGRHKIALLGDMLELGEYSKEEHWKMGRLAGEFVDLLIVVGRNAPIVAEAAKTAGLPEERIRIFEDSPKAGEWVRTQIRVGDLILVKGSQGSGVNMIRMERAVKLLMAHPEEAPRLLVRQEPEWLAQYKQHSST